MYRTGFLLCVLSLLMPCSLAFCAEDAAEDPREQIWWEVAKLLQRREYSIAVNHLEDELSDRERFPQAAGLQTDVDAVKRLRALSEAVDYACRRLEPGSSIHLLGIPHRFKALDQDGTKTMLVLENPRNKEVRQSLQTLDAAAWLKLAEPALENWQQKDLTLAVFLSFDRYRDLKRARDHLNAAAEQGEDVGVWLERLKQVDQRRRNQGRIPESEPSAADQLVGKWLIVAPGKPRVSLDLRSNGRGFVFGTKGRRAIVNWVEEAPNSFRITWQPGFTIVMHVINDRAFGHPTDGTRFRGIRQAE